MTPYELIETISQSCSPSETIEIVNELIGEIDKSPSKYINGLCESIEDYGEIHNLCPLCGSKLTTTNTYQEDRGEYLGFNSQETMYSVECSNPECSYTNE